MMPNQPARGSDSGEAHEGAKARGLDSGEVRTRVRRRHWAAENTWEDCAAAREWLVSADTGASGDPPTTLRSEENRSSQRHPLRLSIDQHALDRRVRWLALAQMGRIDDTKRIDRAPA